MAIDTLPEGFKLDTDPQGSSLPEGFVIDQAQIPQAQPPTQQQQPQEPGIFDKILQSTQALGSGNLAEDIAGGVTSGLENVGLGISQAAADLGAEFGGFKNLLAKIRPDLAKEIQSFTPEDISEALGRRVTEKKAQEKDKGLAFKGSQLVGEVAPFLAGGAGLKGATAAGAAMAATTPQEEGGLEGRAKDTAIGGGLGLFGGVVVKAVSPLVSGATKQVQKLFTAKKPEDIIARRLKPEVTAKLLEKLKNAPPDSPALMIDMAGDDIKGLTRAVGKLSGGRDIVVESLEKRSFEAVERVEKELSKNISSIDTYFGNLDDIAKARSAMAAPLYKKAFEKGTTLDVKKNKILLDKIKPDIAEARKKFRIPKVTDKEVKPIFLKEDEFGRNIIKEFGGLKIAVNDPTNPTFLTVWNKSTNKKVGELRTANKSVSGAEDFVQIGSVEVDKAVQGRGVATELYKSLIEMLPANKKGIFGYATDIASKKAIPRIYRKLGASMDDAGNFIIPNPKIGVKIADNSLVMLDNAKKILDDKISVAIRGGERQQASVLLGIKNELLTELDRLNPDYKKARKVFSDFSSIQSAQEQGLKFSTLKPEQLRRLIDTLAPSEREAFRIGVRSNLEKTVTSTADEADPAKRIFGNSFKRNQIKAVFGGDTQYKAFEKRMKEEIAAAETKFKVLGGSRTDINIAGDKEFVSTVARVGGGAALGSKYAIISALTSSFNKIFGGISEKNAKALANILVKKEGNIKFLENLLKKEKDETQKRLISEFTESIKPILATRLLTKGAIETIPKEQENGNQ